MTVEFLSLRSTLRRHQCFKSSHPLSLSWTVWTRCIVKRGNERCQPRSESRWSRTRGACVLELFSFSSAQQMLSQVRGYTTKCQEKDTTVRHDTTLADIKRVNFKWESQGPNTTDLVEKLLLYHFMENSWRLRWNGYTQQSWKQTKRIVPSTRKMQGKGLAEVCLNRHDKVNQWHLF